MAISNIVKTGALASAASNEGFQETARAYRLVRETKNMTAFGESVNKIEQSFDKFDNSINADGRFLKNFGGEVTNSFTESFPRIEIFKDIYRELQMLRLTTLDHFNSYVSREDANKLRAKMGTEEKREEAAKEKEKAERDKQMLLAMQGKGGGGGGDDDEGKKKKGKFGWKSLLFGGLLVAALAFFNSDKIKEFIKTLKKKIMPALKTFVDDYIKPIWKLWKEGIMKHWESIKKLFTSLKESFKLFGEGKWWEGIKEFFSGLGTYLGEFLDTSLTGLQNVIAEIFGLEKTDSVFGSIKKFFMDIYHDVINWFTLSKLKITTFFNDLIDKVKGFFSFDVKKFMKDMGIGLESFVDWVTTPVDLAITAVKKIFEWGKLKAFNLSKFIGEKIEIIVAWFKGLLDIDFKKIAKSIIPDGTPDVIKRAMGIGGAKEVDSVDREIEVRKEIKEQRKFINQGDDREDALKGFGKRKDILNNLEAELVQILKKRKASNLERGTFEDNRRDNEAEFKRLVEINKELRDRLLNKAEPAGSNIVTTTAVQNRHGIENQFFSMDGSNRQWMGVH